MKPEIKLIALDLDGTVLRTDNTLSPRVKEAIGKAAGRGIEVVAASGRPFGAMPEEVLAIEGVRYVIASNGAAIYKDGERIRSNPLRPESVERLMELTSSYDLIWEAFTDGEIFTDSRYYRDPTRYGCTQAYVGYVRSSRGHLSDMRSFIAENKSRLDSVEFVCTDQKLREALWSRIAEELPELYITSSSKNFVEFMDGAATKSSAMKYICGLLGIEIKSTAAAGNADNDADMLRESGFGAAVSNASPLCLEAADIVVPSNDDDGIAELIDTILP